VTNVPVGPVVRLTSPVNGSQFTACSSVILTATASQSNAAITKVEFFVNGIKIGEKGSPPYTAVWRSIPVGSFAITATATSDNDLSTVSAPAVVNVTIPQLNTFVGTYDTNRVPAAPVLCFACETNKTYEIQASTDYATWVSLTNFTSTNITSLEFVDPEWTRTPHRFFRAVKRN
jgi:hypothetical protein